MFSLFQLLQCVSGVEQVFQTRAGGRTSTLPRPPLPDEMVPPPPRPPPPTGTTYAAPPRPPPPADTDDEDESIFRRQPHPSQPIMVQFIELFLNKIYPLYDINVNFSMYFYRLLLTIYIVLYDNGLLKIMKLLQQQRKWPFLWHVCQSL